LHPPARFISILTFALNYTLNGLNPFGYHLFNVLIHVGAGLGVWALSSQLLQLFSSRKQVPVLSFIAAVIFLAHPVQTQAVSYITQRMASLNAFFYIWSLVTYLQARMFSSKRRWIYFTVSVFLMVAAMFTKETAFTLPLMLILLELKGNKGKIPKKLLGIAPLLFLIPAMYAFNLQGTLLKQMASLSHKGDVLNGYTYLLTQFRVICVYLRLLLIPFGQNLDYDFPVSGHFWDGTTPVCFFILAILTLSALYVRREHPLVLIGWFWFLITLSVESSIIPIQHVIFEHRLYLPSFGIILILVHLISEFLKQHRRKFIYVMAAWVAALSFTTALRNVVWTHPLLMWKDVALKSPRKPRAYLYLGMIYLAHGKYDESIAFFDRALTLENQMVEAMHNRAVAYQQRKEFSQALADIDRAINLEDYHPRFYLTRAKIKQDMKLYPSAMEDIVEALKLNPYFTQAHLQKAILLKQQGRLDQALVVFNQLIKEQPAYTDARYQRALVYLQLRRYPQALIDFDALAQLDPNNVKIFNNRSILRTLKGDYQAALKDLNHVIALKPDFAEGYANRGAVFLKMERLDDALLNFSKAIELDGQYVDAYVNRSSVYLQKNNVAAAKKDLSKILSIDPFHELAQQILKNLE
ncbi:MAG: tetratricopeptide repeat protein, partial [Candidatus Omnitrophica bacterium]|nr:tetratricopeptide repeat protein [Candidatus Omnitrophota bacterium]